MPWHHPTVRPTAGVGHIPQSGRDFTVRFATPADAPELVRLRAVMFESYGVDTSDPDGGSRCRTHVEERLVDERIIGAVVDHPRQVGLVASALAELSMRIPSPSRPTASYAYLSSVSTEPAWRRREMARAAVQLLLHELSNRWVRRVELHATTNGEHLYESLGFRPRPFGKEMRLVL